MSTFHDDDHGSMSFPSPDYPQSGYTPRYAIGSAPEPAPDGMVFVQSMGTYVDADLAAQLGIAGSSQGQAPAAHASFEAQAVQPGHDDRSHYVDDYQVDDEVLVAAEEAQEELEQIEHERREPSLSTTLDDLADYFEPAAFSSGVEALVTTGNAEDALSRVAEATGFDSRTASVLIETAVSEAAPVAVGYIGDDRWDTLVHAASRTDDAFARRVLADFVTGKLHPSNLSKSYSLWFQSLPDGEA